MPRKAALSIMGLYNYDETIFDGFRVPESLEDKRQDIIDEICLEGAELELIYPDPDVMKFAITRWTNLSFNVWDELQKTREYEYNPIWNKDGTYTETETRNLANSEVELRTGTNTVEYDSETDDIGSTTTDATNTKQVMGYNSTTFADAEKEIIDSDGTSNDNFVRHDEQTNTINEQKGIQGTDTGTIRHERIEKGNIGVTTTQQMIQEQREVVKFSVERYIIDSFIERFCLLIY